MHHHTMVTLVLAICFISETVFGDTITVPKDFSTIQAAIDASENGDQILVKNGLYVENIDFCGKGVTVKSESGPNHTFIDGNKKGSVVTFKNSEGPASVLSGFTVMKGSGTVSGTYTLGGGIYCEGASPTLINNIIIYNSVYGVGGGVYCKDASPQISNSLILNNKAEWKGGGIFCDESAPTISWNTITENCTGDGFGSSGGGVCCWNSSSAIITHNLISNNSAKGALGGTGGGIRCSHSSPSISNNIIIENNADMGGGVYCSNKSVKLINNTIAWNTASECGGGVFFKMGPMMEVVNTILWSNSAINGRDAWIGSSILPATFSINYSLISNSTDSIYLDPMCVLDWGSTVIQKDPGFVDSLSRDVHLTAFSPCINTGLNMSQTSSNHDVEGDPRISFGATDIGADEFHEHLYCTGDITAEGFIEIKVIGKPCKSPVLLWVGSEILQKPLHTRFGDWMLGLPTKSSIVLGAIPKTGLLKIKRRIPKNFPKMKIPIQALINRKLTNHYIVKSSKHTYSKNEGQ